jgi:hypothetical protein
LGWFRQPPQKHSKHTNNGSRKSSKLAARFYFRRDVKEEAGASEAGLGFLQLGDVDGGDVEAGGFDAGAGAREGGGEDDRVVEGEGVGGVRLLGGDIDPVVVCQRRRVEAGVIGEQGVAAEMRDGGFQVQAAGDGDGDDFVVVRGEDFCELADAFGIGARGEADEQGAADAEDIAAFKGGGRRDVFELAEFGEGLREGGGFGAAGLRAEGKDDGEFVEDDGGIFDKHGIGESGFGGERDDASAELFEQMFVSAMLFAGGFEVDGLAREEGEFAIDDGGADGAGDGDEHRRRKFTRTRRR